jgi:hypothetical protein
MKDGMDMACYLYGGNAYPDYSNTQRKRAFGTAIFRWEDHFTRNIEEVVWEVVALMHLAQGRNQWRLLNTIINVLVL